MNEPRPEISLEEARRVDDALWETDVARGHLKNGNYLGAVMRLEAALLAAKNLRDGKREEQT